MSAILTQSESYIGKPKKPVLTKVDFVRRYAAGEFGNASPTWNNVDEFGLSKYRGLVHIRNRIAGGPTWYDIPWFQVWSRWWQLVHGQNVDPLSLYISAMAPTEKTLFQGEVQRGLWGLDLLYTTVAKPMRQALAMRSRQVCGIIAVCLLRHFLCPRSYDWLMYLLDAYPNHVVEFSTYSVCWGTVPSYNSVFWEVRLY